MPGHPLEQLKGFSKNYADDVISRLSGFLVYVKDRVGRVELFDDNKREMGMVYHQVWYFRDNLIRRYSDKDEYDELPAHLYENYKRDAEKSVQSLLKKKDNGLHTSVSVPNFLVCQMDSVIKKLESLDIAPEGLKTTQDTEYYVTKDRDQYFYNQAPLKLKMGSQYRLAFDIVFDVNGGEGGVCTYSTFEKELQKRDAKLHRKLRARGDNGVRDWAQDNLTVKTKGVLNKVPKKDLLTTQEGVGFVFNNKK